MHETGGDRFCGIRSKRLLDSRNSGSGQRIDMRPVLLPIQPINIVLDSRLFLTALPRLKKHAERSHMYHTEREGLMSSSSQGLNFIHTEKFVAWRSHQKRLGHDEFSERE